LQADFNLKPVPEFVKQQDSQKENVAGFVGVGLQFKLRGRLEVRRTNYKEFKTSK
jgi:hypothetical protein